MDFDAFETLISSLGEQLKLESNESNCTFSHKSPLDKGDIIRVLHALDNRSIRALLSIFRDLTGFNRCFKKWSPLYFDTLGLANEVIDSLGQEWLNYAQELRNIIHRPHFQALMWACDEIANERYEPSLPKECECSSLTTSINEFFDDMSSVKIVQVIKNEEPLGATIKFDDVTGDTIVSRIIHGGAAHRSGLINVGDCIQEVNGVSLRGRSFADIVAFLENECRSHIISFKLIPSNMGFFKKSSSSESQVRVKALFDYDAQEDVNHPCPGAGLNFRKGDVLHVVNLQDTDWWQAKHEATINDDDYSDSFHFLSSRAGIIPSKQLQEKRIVVLRDRREQTKSLSSRFRTHKDNKSYHDKLKRGLKYRKVKKIMYRVNEADELDREEIPTYMEVALIKPKNGEYRPIVLICPHPIDSNLIIELLMTCEPIHFARPVPHTTRQPQFWEQDGYDYHFAEKEWFLEQVEHLQFVEYGQYNGNYYGIHIDSVHSIIRSGRVCLLNPKPKVLKLLYRPTIKPYIIFLQPSYHVLYYKPNSLIPLCVNSEKIPVRVADLKQMAVTSTRLEKLYGHFFDRLIVIKNQDQLIRSLLETLKMLEMEEQWVPTDWITY